MMGLLTCLFLVAAVCIFAGVHEVFGPDDDEEFLGKDWDNHDEF